LARIRYIRIAMNNLTFYIRLTWLCFKLFFDLLVFLFVFLLEKINKSQLALFLLIVLFFSVWIFNFYLFNQKTTPKIDLEKITNVQNLDKNFLKPQVKVLKDEDLEKTLEYYKKIDEKKIKNLSLFLNLSQLNKANGNEDLSKKYVDQAQQIEPKIKNF